MAAEPTQRAPGRPSEFTSNHAATVDGSRYREWLIARGKLTPRELVIERPPTPAHWHDMPTLRLAGNERVEAPWSNQVWDAVRRHERGR